MRLIDADALIAEYDRVHIGEPAGRDSLMVDAPTVETFGWICVEDRMPGEFVSVLGYMTDAGNFPPVRECYVVGNMFFFPSLGDIHPVSHWMPMPEPPNTQGKWVRGDYNIIRCSKCKTKALFQDDGKGYRWHVDYCTSNFCPNCGAKMDRERKDKRDDQEM